MEAFANGVRVNADAVRVSAATVAEMLAKMAGERELKRHYLLRVRLFGVTIAVWR